MLCPKTYTALSGTKFTNGTTYHFGYIVWKRNILILTTTTVKLSNKL